MIKSVELQTNTSNHCPFPCIIWKGNHTIHYSKNLTEMTKLTGRTEFGASRFFLSCFSHFPIRSLGAHLSGTESSSFPCGSLFFLLFPQWPLGLWTFLPDPGSPVLLASQPLASAASHRLPLLAELGQGGAGGAQALPLGSWPAWRCPR